MNVLVGTSGYQYKEWKGTFYPDDMPTDGMLSYYAGVFPTCEINNTFYRMSGFILTVRLLLSQKRPRESSRLKAI